MNNIEGIMKHSIGVAKYMYEKAEDKNLDKYKMLILGLLHDIGKIEDEQSHDVFGFDILNNTISDKIILRAIRSHHTNPDMVCKMSGMNCNTPEYRLLIEAECCINEQGEQVSYDERLEEIKSLYGDNSDIYKNMCEQVDYIKYIRRL